MKTVRSLILLFCCFACSLLALTSCGKDNDINPHLRKLQRANIRMKVDNPQPGTKGVGVEGDSAAVMHLLRTAYDLWGSDWDWLSENWPEAANEYWSPFSITLNVEDNWMTGRDTVARIFIFNFEAVYGYNKYDVLDDGTWVGVPGEEAEGWLLKCNDIVLTSCYDLDYHRYRNPFIKWREDTPYSGNSRMDTVGYIPQKLVEENREVLKQLFAAKRYEEMEEFMADSYRIYTCTGEEYRELVRLGLN